MVKGSRQQQDVMEHRYAKSVQKIRALQQTYAETDEQADTQAETQTSVQTHPQTETVAEAQSAAETQSQADVQTDTQVDAQGHTQETRVDSQANTKPQAAAFANQQVDAQARTETFVQAETFASAQALPVAEPLVGADAQGDTFAESQQQVETSVEALRQRVQSGTRRQRLEDMRRRQTYWLTDAEIRYVDELASATGLTKYEVVGVAIRELYRLVMRQG